VSGSRLEVKMKIFAHGSYGAKKQLLTKCLAHKKARSMGSGLLQTNYLANALIRPAPFGLPQPVAKS